MKYTFVLSIVLCFCGILDRSSHAQTKLSILRPFLVDSSTYEYGSLAASDDHNFSATAIRHDLRTTLYSYVVLRTINGGTTWAIQSLPLPLFRSIPTRPDFNEVNFSRILQLDSLRAVAVGDSGWIFRTTDAGASWNRIAIPFKDRLLDVSIAEDGSGVISGGPIVAITSDTGGSWNIVPKLNTWSMSSCHTYGMGRFFVYHLGNGPLYTTSNDWVSIDSSYLFPDDSLQHLNISDLQYIGGDTILGYGAGDGTSSLHRATFFMVSSNNGITWSTLVNRSFPYCYASATLDASLSSLWIGGGPGMGILYSRDRGATWINDTTIVENSPNMQFLSLHPTISLSNGTAVGITNALGEGDNIVRIEPTPLHVDSYEHQIYGAKVYPNPARSAVAVNSAYLPLCPVWLVDVLGHANFEGTTDNTGVLRFDVSHLPSGVYELIAEYRGSRLRVTNLVVLSGLH